MRQAQAHLHDAQVVSVMGMVGMAGLGFLQQEHASNETRPERNYGTAVGLQDQGFWEWTSPCRMVIRPCILLMHCCSASIPSLGE